ncbi:mRNA export factor GLE1-like [Pocillopora verrucosa]|uniref:mRNA export factor GLE1-like n=1 Tax=Pocillopora verrucosa TaxID=203993 RepID=UPI0033400E34
MLCREILVVDPFTGTKKGTVARGTRWEEVAKNLNKIQQIYFKVDKRAVQDRYNLLSKELRNKLKREEKESGIETDMTEVEMALEELIEKEDAAETEQKVVENQKKVKDSQDRENAESVQKKAMERLGQTQKRQQLEVESRKQENFMQMMLNQQQQQQRQMQDFQVMMSVQTKQQNDLMIALVSKLIEKK